MLATGPFRRHAARWLEPELDLPAHLFANLAPAHHQSGTCRMGPDARDSVVGPDLRVHGLTGLLVADSSVFPDTVMHNTNLACYMIGEVAADPHSLEIADLRPVELGQDARQHRQEAVGMALVERQPHRSG